MYAPWQRKSCSPSDYSGRAWSLYCRDVSWFGEAAEETLDADSRPNEDAMLSRLISKLVEASRLEGAEAFG